jgi:AraC family transcriptional regulator
MFRPESDWTGQNRPGVEGFGIDHRFSMRDVDVDIRRFDWCAPSEGSLAPAKHYVDFSLTSPLRRSVLDVDAWKGPRTSGDILYLAPDFLYWGKPAMEHRRLLCIAIGDEFLEDLFQTQRPFGDLLPCADMQVPRLRQILCAIAQEMETPGFASETLLESLLISTAIDLARYLRNREPADCPRSRASERQVRNVSDYIMANLSQSLGISDIARECGISTRHLARVFKEGTGLALGEFITQNRIALAKQLLAGENLQIKEISWRCGFRSTSAFSAAFRTAVGMTPRTYREGGARRH